MASERSFVRLKRPLVCLVSIYLQFHYPSRLLKPPKTYATDAMEELQTITLVSP
jgi:hypothetical protein